MSSTATVTSMRIDSSGRPKRRAPELTATRCEGAGIAYAPSPALSSKWRLGADVARVDQVFARERFLPELTLTVSAGLSHRRVEDGRGSLGHAATLRFPSPLIKPDVRISRIRLSDWFQPAAHGGAPSSVCVAEAVGDGRRAQQHRSASVFAAG